MSTGKMNMELIDNEKTRRLTFERRKKCLFKKAYELSVLCDVDVCVVLSGCLSANQRNDQWQTWPENLGEVGRIIRKFEVKKPSKNMANTSNILVQRQENAGEKSAFPFWDSRIDSFSFERLINLLEVVDKKLAAIDERMTALKTTQVGELPIIDFSSEEENFTVHGLQTGQSDMDWIDYLNLDNFLLPEYSLNDGIFHDLPMKPLNEILQPEKFQSLPQPDNHSLSVILHMEPNSERGYMHPGHTCCLKEMNYFSTVVGGPSQWSSLPPLSHSNAPWLDFPLNNDGCIPNENLYIPINPQLEKGVEQPDHDGCMNQMAYYSMAGNPPTQPSELPPLPYASTSSAAFLPPSNIPRAGFCGGDYYYPTNNKEEDLFLRFNNSTHYQWD